MAWTGDEGAFQGFIAEHGLTFPQISDDSGIVFARFGVPSQPAFVLVGANGDTETILGAVDEETLDGALDVLAAP